MRGGCVDDWTVDDVVAWATHMKLKVDTSKLKQEAMDGNLLQKVGLVRETLSMLTFFLRESVRAREREREREYGCVSLKDLFLKLKLYSNICCCDC